MSEPTDDEVWNWATKIRDEAVRLRDELAKRDAKPEGSGITDEQWKELTGWRRREDQFIGETVSLLKSLFDDYKTKFRQPMPAISEDVRMLAEFVDAWVTPTNSREWHEFKGDRNLKAEYAPIAARVLACPKDEMPEEVRKAIGEMKNERVCYTKKTHMVVDWIEQRFPKPVETVLPCPVCGSEAKVRGNENAVRCANENCVIGQFGYWYLKEHWAMRPAKA